ncbi:hypothetical protein G6011_07600 [Alternaria panax]|uniref:F-box domain-containing protein n=1 Tax=Alternaria panax TaxID=48097 RepID=A0AAD4I4V2_9PLEO|nr:hypothetical protein G6011_07600 [Alternaria panax]
MAPPIVSWLQKRKSSISNTSASNKRTRSVSISVKVSHGAIPEGLPDSPELPVVPKNPQACLGGIPEELLLHIMEHVHPNRIVLAKLCLTDRRCKRVAEEVLYRNICSRSLNYNKARSVAGNPVLASHLRHFDAAFGETIVWPTMYNGRKAVDAETARSEYNKVLANAHKIQTFALEENRRYRWTNESEELPRDLGWLELFNNAVAQSVDRHANRFAHLKKLTIITNLLSVEDISCVFRLPSLHSLFLQDVHQTTPFKNWSIPTSSSPIQEFALRNAMMDISAVVQMISSVKSLCNFMYDHSNKAWEPFGGEHSPMSIWPEHSWMLLGDALRTHRDTLEELYAFNYSDKALLDVVYPNGRDFGTLGSFQDFPKLQFCGIPIEAFLDITTCEEDLSVYLPPHLRRWYTHITPGTPKLLERCVPALASLRDVVCEGQDKTVRVVLLDGLPFQALELSRAFKVLEKAGINLEIRYDYAMITLDDLKQLEAPLEVDESDEESDGDQEDEADEAGGEDLSDAMEEEILDMLYSNSLASSAVEESMAADQLEDDMEFAIPAASHRVDPTSFA